MLAPADASWTQVGCSEGLATDIEITFEPAGDGTSSGSSRRASREAARFRDGYSMGWKEVLGWFAEHTNRKEVR